ncbi:hypothetical protein AA313_de0207915 [Arthrobotrys entomopaga]|nr:hypothetical protein AA313_de0207915 [Arthrobotrys entomopaga]
MDGLSAASAVISVIDASVSVAKVCAQYIKEVKGARKDIEEVKAKAETLHKLSTHAQDLLNGSKKEKFRASKELGKAINDCKDEIEALQNKLTTEFSIQIQIQTAQQQKRRNKLLGKVGITTSDFKWPFTKSEVNAIVTRLDRFQDLINSALQIDEIHIILSIEQEANLAKLPISGGARFGSSEDQQEPECLPETRVELLSTIKQWITTAALNIKPAGYQSKPIFWLCGMAGTGKSTIARTVARLLRDKAQLGASFFFKRGKANRSDTTRLITTIAMDLKVHIPQLGPKICDAIEQDPNIHTSALSEQFEKLVFKPLSQIDPKTVPSPTVIVIDALDECDGNIQQVITFLEHLQELRFDLRIFITSRPETPIQLGFKELADSTQNVALHDIQQDTIKHDISIFVRHEISEMRKTHGFPEKWPGDNAIETLVEISLPLFISAATACRFIADKKPLVQRRLDAILKQRNVKFVSKLAQTYLPVFGQLLEDTDEDEKEYLTAEFQEVIGTIVLLESPLSLGSLSRLIDKPEDQINTTLDPFQSVINTPEDPNLPIQTFHLSFRDFLLDTSNKEQWFWLDKDQIHKQIFAYCIRLLSESLKENICNLKCPGAMCSDLSDEVEVNVTLEVQYACQYWVSHLEQCKNSLSEEDKKQVYSFLKEHLLHWLEVMNLLKVGFQAIYLIMQLELAIQSSGGDMDELLKFLNDAKRFVQLNQQIATQAPLQLYSSALIFTPESSLVRKAFWHKLPKWIKRVPKVRSHWSPLIQTLEGFQAGGAINFSPNGKYLAAASDSGPIALWDANSGAMLQTFDGHINNAQSIVFSTDGKRLVSTAPQDAVKLWDIASGNVLRTIAMAEMASVNLSPDGTKFGSLSRKGTIELWDVLSGDLLQTLSHDTDIKESDAGYITFSSDGRRLASISGTNFKIWDLVSATPLYNNSHPDYRRMMHPEFSPDSKILVVSVNRELKVWDAESGTFLYDLYEGMRRTDFIRRRSLVFSPDGKYLAFAVKTTILILEIESKKVVKSFEEREIAVVRLAFSPDGSNLASRAHGVIRIWETTTPSEAVLTSVPVPKSNNQDKLWWPTFSPDGRFLVASVWDNSIGIWEVASGVLIQTREHGPYHIIKFEFSPDGTRLASIDGNGGICLWDVRGSLELVHKLYLEDYIPEYGCFSSNPWWLAYTISRTSLPKVEIWDLANGSLASEIAVPEGSNLGFIAISADGKILATQLSKRIIVWDIASGLPLDTIDFDSRGPFSFSPDGQFLIFQLEGAGAHVWNRASGTTLSLGYSSRGRHMKAWAFPADGELMAARSSSEISLWDRSSSVEIGSIPYRGIDRLAFSQTGDYLETNVGRFGLQDLGMAVHVQDPHRSKQPLIHFRDNWINYNGCNILWVSPEYRDSVMHGNTFAFSSPEGDMSFLEISDPFS